MSRIILRDTETTGRSFVISGRSTKNFCYVLSQDRTTAQRFDVDLGVYKGGSNALVWRTVENDSNNNALRTTRIPNETPTRIVATVVAATSVLALDGGGDQDIFFGPYRNVAARTLALNLGETHVMDMARDFRLETLALGGMNYSVVSSSSTIISTTVDASGAVTINAIGSGTANSTVTVRDRFGMRASQVVTVTVT